MGERLLFMLWWIWVDGVRNYLAMDFLLYAARVKGKGYRAAWLAGSTVFTAAAVWTGAPWMFFPANLLFLLFARYAAGISWQRLGAPAAVVFTLCTFAEGGADLALSYLAANVRLGGFGAAAQVLIYAGMDVFLLAAFYGLKKRYENALSRQIPSCLYLLLLPCAALVLAVRLGLLLDSPAFAGHLLSLGRAGSLSLLALMAAAAVTFFAMVEAFCSIGALAERKQEAALLAGRLKGQRGYVEEAKRRSEQYAAWQHEIDNHLLVLSGFLKEQRYIQAQRYAGKLCESSRRLAPFVSTGNAAVDILLREKVSDAKGSGIEVACDVQLKGFGADEMDLCIIFSNIMDNAISACRREERGKRQIILSGRIRSSLLLVDARNTCTSSLPVRMGTGLSNVKNIAEKYKGAVDIARSGGIFRISVLLCSGENEW